MKIALRPEIEAFVEQEVGTGRFTDASHLVNYAIEFLRERSRETPEETAELRRMVEEGIAELDRGEYAEFSAAEISAEGRRILAARDKRKRVAR